MEAFIAPHYSPKQEKEYRGEFEDSCIHFISKMVTDKDSDFYYC